MVKGYIQAARLRTLFLALCGPLAAAALANAGIEKMFELKIFIFHLITAVCLQILSNYANDLGDFTKGTDSNAGRSDRALAGGSLSVGQMKNAIYVLVVISFISGIALLFQSFAYFNARFLLFLVLGLVAIAAAIKYTMGKSAYGYKALGDVSVFLFFGLVAVAGGFYLYTHTITLTSILLSICFGSMAVAVLNINNIRDINSDTLSNKSTLANKWGKPKAINYQKILLSVAWISSVLALVVKQRELYQGEPVNVNQMAMMPIVFLPFLILFINHTRKLKEANTTDTYNKQLKTVSLLSFALALYWLLLAFLLF